MNKKFKYRVWDTGNSCVIKEYKSYHHACKKRDKELKERNLPHYFIIVQKLDNKE